MHVLFSAWAASCIISTLPTVTAFYPYIVDRGDNQKARRDEQLPQRAVTFPIQRVPRDNIYNIIKSKDPKQENSIAIHQDADKSYMVAVTFGDSKDEYHLLLDSAASNTWVMSKACKTDACSTHSLLGEEDSSTLKVESTQYSITYGTGTSSGVVASDTVHIGSMSIDLTFGLATNVTDEFRSYPMDGILGIGRGDNVLGTVEAPRVMDVLKTSNLIDSKLCGVHLSRVKDGVNDGELNFGEPNKDRYDGDLNYIPLVPNTDGFWQLAVDDIGVDGVGLGIFDRTALLDTGTSFIFMPEDDAAVIHDLIGGYTKSGQTVYIIPCNTTKSIWISFGGQKYNISPADYIGDDLGNGNCISNIIGRQTFGEKQWLLGDVFLKNVYTVFDYDNEQVGFGVKGAEKEEEEEEEETSSSSKTGTATPSKTSASDASQTDSPAAEATGTQVSQTGSTAGNDASGSANSTGGATHASTFLSPFLLSFALSLLALV